MKEVRDISVASISTGGRFRKDFGDVQALADSIANVGLLQPIGVDSADRLVFGERRLLAYKMLGRDRIPALRVDLDSLLKGEYAENEFRKDFTPSERVAIGKAIEAELGQRQGQRTDIQLPENLPEVPKGDTRDLAAKAAGFGNGKTYEQAKQVVDKGAPELVAAVDAGKVIACSDPDMQTTHEGRQ